MPQQSGRLNIEILRQFRHHLNMGRACRGAKLRIVNTAMAVGSRIMSARTEASPYNAPYNHMIRAHVVILVDLGQHYQAFMRHWDTCQDGTLSSQTHAKVVACMISRVYATPSIRLFRKGQRLMR